MRTTRAALPGEGMRRWPEITSCWASTRTATRTMLKPCGMFQGSGNNPGQFCAAAREHSKLDIQRLPVLDSRTCLPGRSLSISAMPAQSLGRSAMMADGHNEALRFHMASTAESIVGAGRRCHMVHTPSWCQLRATLASRPTISRAACKSSSPPTSC